MQLAYPTFPESLGLVLAAPPSPPDRFLSSPGLSLLRERRLDELSVSFSLPGLSRDL